MVKSKLFEYASDLYTLAVSQFKRGMIEEAITNFARSLKLLEEIHGPDNPGLIEWIMGYASMLWREASGHEAEAKDLIKRSIEIAETNFGPEHPDIGPCLVELGELYSQLGRDDEARMILDRAQAIGVLH